MEVLPTPQNCNYFLVQVEVFQGLVVRPYTTLVRLFGATQIILSGKRMISTMVWTLVELLSDHRAESAKWSR